MNVKIIVSIIIKYLKMAWNEYKLNQSMVKLEKSKREAKNEVKEAIDSYDKLMDLHDKYKSGKGDSDL